MWTIPDHDVVALLDTLKRKKVRRILDVGFGLGRHVVFFTKEGFETYGIDISQSGFDYCNKWLEVEELKADLRMGNMLSLPYENTFFDFVIAYNVVYHGTFLQMKKALAEIHRVLRQGGLVYITLYSVRNSNYRVGTEIEPNTFLNPKKHDGDFPHHFSDEQEVRSLFQNWKIINLKDREQTLAGKIYKDTYHWLIIASKR
jgi:SAM-dependent methyltransferase